jgi:hypothetical protein
MGRLEPLTVATDVSCISRVGHMLGRYTALPGTHEQDVRAWRGYHASASEELEQRWARSRARGGGSGAFDEALAHSIFHYRQMVCGVLLGELARGHPPEVEGGPFTPDMWLDEDLDTLDHVGRARSTVQVLLDFLRPRQSVEGDGEVARIDRVLESELPRLRQYFSFHEGDVLGDWERQQERLGAPPDSWWLYPTRPRPPGAGDPNEASTRPLSAQPGAVSPDARPVGRHRRTEILLAMIRTVVRYGSGQGRRNRDWDRPELPRWIGQIVYHGARLGHLVGRYAALPSVAKQDLLPWVEFHQSTQEDPGHLHRTLRFTITQYRAEISERLGQAVARGCPAHVNVAPCTPDAWIAKHRDILDRIAEARGTAQAIADLAPRTAWLEESRAQLERLDGELRSTMPRLRQHFALYEQDALTDWEREQERLCFPREWWWHYPTSL